MKNVLIIDTIHPALEEQLKAHAFSFVDGTTLSKEEIKNIIHDFIGVVIRSRFMLDKDILEKAINLHFIARAGAGMENIDVAYANERGITCINAPEANRVAVGEHALAMLLSLFNNLMMADSQVRKGQWIREENRGTELTGKTVGIIGFGNMGSAFAAVLLGFNVKILVYDKYIKIDTDQYQNVRQVEMNEIFENADVISFHIPITPETKFMINEKFLSEFRNNIYIINTSRGKILRTTDLVEAMKSGKVKGACLDVVEYEGVSFEQLSTDELPDTWHYLVNSENVVLSPHIAGWTFESHRKISEILADKILQLYKAGHE